MSSLSLYTKIESLPPDLKQEATDFIEFLIEKTKAKKGSSDSKKPKFGVLKGKIHLSADFDAPLEDFKEYM